MSRPIDFATFRRSRRPNNVLALPAGFTAASDADAESPVFDTDARALAQAARSIVLEWPRTTLVRDLDDQYQFAAVQRTKLCRWPDTITVQALPADGGGATLAIYSAAKYGYRDFGVNERRVKALLDALKATTATR